MTKYRKIYEQHYGPIPKGYHIHHKDMNHANDDPLNLEALSPDEHAQKHGFLTNFIMAQSTAVERSHASRRKPENRARAALKTKAQWDLLTIEDRGIQVAAAHKAALGNKFTRTPEDIANMRVRMKGKKHALGVKHSSETNAANAERGKAQWAAMTQEEKDARGRTVSVSLVGNTRTLGKTWKHNNIVKSHYLASWTPERRIAHSLRMKGKTWKWKNKKAVS